MTTELHDHTRRCWWNPDEARWICPGGAPERPLVDVRDMLVVHTALLREFRLAPAAVMRTPAWDRRQAAAVGRHLRFVCDLLHHHHEGEDALLWPTLRERVPEATGRLVDDAEAQHRGIDDALGRVPHLLAAWVAEADPDRGAELGGGLEKVHALLAEHLDLEERVLLPLAAAALTADEWHAIGEEGVKAVPKPQLALTFGMFAYEGDAAVLRGMLALAPLVPRTLLPLIAPRVYARRARAVHGTARP